MLQQLSIVKSRLSQVASVKSLFTAVRLVCMNKVDLLYIQKKLQSLKCFLPPDSCFDISFADFYSSLFFLLKIALLHISIDTDEGKISDIEKNTSTNDASVNPSEIELHGVRLGHT